MILVLLYRFCEALDSLVGYKLCQKLVHEGHHLFVTTTARREEAKAEMLAAEQMSKSGNGSVTILEPEYEELEEPTPEWIAKLHKTYFSNLQVLKNVDLIIGALPGTTKTAVDLKKSLNCKLVLLAATKIGADEEQLKSEINRLCPEADEVWSVGSDIHSYYQDIFHEVSTPSEISHKELLLQPCLDSKTPKYYWKWNTPEGTYEGGIKKVVSVWNDGYPFFYKGKRTVSKGSALLSHQALNAALANINKDAGRRNSGKLHWNIHGLKDQRKTVNSIQSYRDSQYVKLNALGSVSSLDELTWNNCVAFVVPDIHEDNFNFVALTALWLGIPTLLSKESTVGQFLMQLNCTEKFKPLVSLTGDFKKDKEEWIQKIYTEILNKSARPMQWAKNLSLHLHNQGHLWKMDPAIFVPTPKITCLEKEVKENTVLKTFTQAGKAWSENVFEVESLMLHCYIYQL